MFERIKDGIFQLVKSRLFVLIIAFVLMFGILIAKVFNLQIVKGQDYLDQYTLTIRKTNEVQGTRGNILDRNGNILASNKLAYSLTIEDNGDYETRKEKNSILNETINQIIDIVERNEDSVINNFGIVIDANDNYAFVAANETQKLRFLADIYGYQTIDELTKKQRESTPDDVIDYLCNDEQFGFGIDQKKTEKIHVLKMINIRYAMSLNSFRKYIPTTIATNVKNETAAVIMENLDSLQGVNIVPDSLRYYEDGVYFSSLLGYTGKISQEEYDTYKNEKKNYSLLDIVGKAGLEQSMDEELQGTKEKETVYVDSVGKVLEKEKGKEAQAGNDLVLTIDKNLQIATYHILEEKLAGILLSKIQNVMNYTPDPESDASKIIIPIDDVYNAFFGNEILSLDHLKSPQAGAVEQGVFAQFTGKQDAVLAELLALLSDPSSPAYKDLSKEQQAYMNYIATDVLQTNTKVLMRDEIDIADEVYLSWTKEETINLYTYLNYASSKNWIDTSKLQEYIPDNGKYSDSGEVYQSILTFLSEYLRTDVGFQKLIYKYMIKGGEISGTQIGMMLYEQNLLVMDEAKYNALATGALDPYTFMLEKIQTLEITPGQLALEPCTASAVVTDVTTGEVLACVSYPGYDNNRLANTMDSAYYSKLGSDLSHPFYNNATQEKTAPGSTYKMVSSAAGLAENVIAPDTYISCTGIFDKITPSPKCWIYPGSHGALEVVGSLSHSCNDFYYELGYRLGLTPQDVADENGNVRQEEVMSNDLGLEKLGTYAALFGLNEKSGLEIQEAAPEISDKDVVRSAIGQGSNNFTNSQLARYVTAVANGGSVFKLSLLDRLTDVDGNLIKDYQPELTRTITEVPPGTWDLLHSGMRQMVVDSATFNNMPMAMSGKTGTAQQSTTHPDHALFVGYAPAEAPAVGVSVRIANGYNSSYAAEIGRDIIQYQYALADPAALVTGRAAELGTAAAGD